jgi:hypothetical protein
MSPRLSASYTITDQLKLNASVGRYYKIPTYTVLGYTDSTGKYVNKTADYISSNHYVTGVEVLPKWQGSRLTLEGFYKQYGNYPISKMDGISLANKGGDFNVLGNEPISSTGKGRSYGVEFQFGAVALPLADGHWRVGPGQTVRPGRVWVCSGEDFETLYPEVFIKSGLIKCKLQMMRAELPNTAERLGVMMAAGLTLCHYKSFAGCATLPQLRQRLTAELPEFEKYGIHVLVSQQGTGEITLGDSHEYDGEIEPYDKERIHDLVLRYLATFLELDGLRITTRWSGCYAKHPEKPYFTAAPEENVMIVNGPSGAGMTLSFGLAERVIGSVL